MKFRSQIRLLPCKKGRGIQELPWTPRDRHFTQRASLAQTLKKLRENADCHDHEHPRPRPRRPPRRALPRRRYQVRQGDRRYPGRGQARAARDPPRRGDRQGRRQPRAHRPGSLRGHQGRPRRPRSPLHRRLQAGHLPQVPGTCHLLFLQAWPPNGNFFSRAIRAIDAVPQRTKRETPGTARNARPGSVPTDGRAYRALALDPAHARVGSPDSTSSRREEISTSKIKC